MGKPGTPTRPAPESIERGHEPDRTRIGIIVGVSVGLALLVIASAVAVRFLVDALATGRGRDIEPSTARFGLVEPSEEKPVWDLGLEAFQLHAAQRLSGYEWIDQEDGIARIPIERAMEIVAERGIDPVTPRDAGEEGATP